MTRTMLLALMATGGLLLPEQALAQGYDDLDNSASEEDAPSSRRAEREVREVVKGVYAKSNVGGASYLLNFRGWVRNGTTVGLPKSTISNGGSLR